MGCAAAIAKCARPHFLVLTIHLCSTRLQVDDAPAASLQPMAPLYSSLSLPSSLTSCRCAAFAAAALSLLSLSSLVVCGPGRVAAGAVFDYVQSSLDTYESASCDLYRMPAHVSLRFSYTKCAMRCARAPRKSREKMSSDYREYPMPGECVINMCGTGWKATRAPACTTFQNTGRKSRTAFKRVRASDF